MCSKEHKDLKIKVENNYANEPLKGTNSVAAYMSLTNQSNEDLNLNGIICQGSHKALLHKLKKNASKETMSMQRIQNLILSPNEKINFEPGGKHVMIIGLNYHLIKQKKIECLLTSKKGESFSVTFPFK